VTCLFAVTKVVIFFKPTKLLFTFLILPIITACKTAIERRNIFHSCARLF
jgi:hypothetical protein